MKYRYLELNIVHFADFASKYRYFRFFKCLYLFICYSFLAVNHADRSLIHINIWDTENICCSEPYPRCISQSKLLVRQSVAIRRESASGTPERTLPDRTSSPTQFIKNVVMDNKYFYFPKKLCV